MDKARQAGGAEGLQHETLRASVLPLKRFLGSFKVVQAWLVQDSHAWI
jgi:hypothetical protein